MPIHYSYLHSLRSSPVRLVVTQQILFINGPPGPPTLGGEASLACFQLMNADASHSLLAKFPKLGSWEQWNDKCT
jgi:hypothetical protein